MRRDDDTTAALLRDLRGALFRHDELMAARGFYHDLYASQFEEALEEAV